MFEWIVHWRFFLAKVDSLGQVAEKGPGLFPREH